MATREDIIALLEKVLNETPSADTCPKCGQQTYELVSHPDPVIAEKGERAYECCACGFVEAKLT